MLINNTMTNKEEKGNNQIGVNNFRLDRLVHFSTPQNFDTLESNREKS